MEILIYVGAVCVTIIFAVMLAEPDEPPVTAAAQGLWWWGGRAGGACGVRGFPVPGPESPVDPRRPNG
jgi:NADH:ubiquinone oxidoreductase subunit 6 (subunit J)